MPTMVKLYFRQIDWKGPRHNSVKIIDTKHNSVIKHHLGITPELKVKNSHNSEILTVIFPEKVRPGIMPEVSLGIIPKKKPVYQPVQ